jgi:Tfp pilus assembly protein PilE
MNIKNIKAFTFVELVVVVTILAVLWAIWFSSYIWSLSDTRDSQRKSDFAQVSSALKIYKQKRWYYAYPWEVFNIQYDWNTIAYQWKLNTNVRLNSLDKLPYDPKTKKPYFFTITKTKQEFELAWTLENSDNPIALMIWNYKSVSKNVLPALNLATNVAPWTNIEIKDDGWTWSINRKLFIYNNQQDNLPYDFTEPYYAKSDWISFDDLLSQVENNQSYWQNTDFRNCIEIQEWWKALIPFTSTADIIYQIITDTWSLVDTGCTN